MKTFKTLNLTVLDKGLSRLKIFFIQLLPALTSDDDITFSDGEARRAVNGEVSVSLLVSVVLSDVMQVIFSNDDGSGHLGGDDDTPEM